MKTDLDFDVIFKSIVNNKPVPKSDRNKFISEIIWRNTSYNNGYYSKIYVREDIIFSGYLEQLAQLKLFTSKELTRIINRAKKNVYLAYKLFGLLSFININMEDKFTLFKMIIRYTDLLKLFLNNYTIDNDQKNEIIKHAISNPQIASQYYPIIRDYFNEYQDMIIDCIKNDKYLYCLHLINTSKSEEAKQIAIKSKSLTNKIFFDKYNRLYSEISLDDKEKINIFNKVNFVIFFTKHNNLYKVLDLITHYLEKDNKIFNELAEYLILKCKFNHAKELLDYVKNNAIELSNNNIEKLESLLVMKTLIA